MPWVRISAGQAALHPLYGVRGWLVVLAVALVLGLLRIVVEIQKYFESMRAAFAQAAKINGALTDTQEAMFQKWLWSAPVFKYSAAVIVDATISACLAIAVLAALSSKSRRFRPLYNVLFCWAVTSALVVLSFLASDNVPLTEATSIFAALAVSIPWLIYVNVSRRVRITTSHEIRDSDPLNLQPAILAQIRSGKTQEQQEQGDILLVNRIGSSGEQVLIREPANLVTSTEPISVSLTRSNRLRRGYRRLAVALGVSVGLLATIVPLFTEAFIAAPIIGLIFGLIAWGVTRLIGWAAVGFADD